MRDEISLKLLADTYPDVIVSRETPSSTPPPPPGLHPTSTTDGRWPPSLVAAGAIIIYAIVVFPTASTDAVVTNHLLQLSKVSLRAARPT